MVKPDWDKFKAKFSENPQENLEWFCYLLFCKEFDQPLGMFRYKNQSAIETDPITIEDQVIGWQAKFYDSTLSNHKDEILKSIINAKRYYPDITKLLFYTNQEWGQNKGRKPQGLKDIEAEAKKLALTLVWRTASFFESEFVSKDNILIAQYFFSFDRSVFEVIEDQKKHTQNILQEIQTCISFRQKRFEIDRNDLLDEIKDKSHKVIIINGVGGVGKTVLIKKLYEQVKDEIPFYVFKATEFELRSINELFVGLSFYEFSQVHADVNEKIVVIDSSEKLLDLKNSDPFKEFLSEIIKNRWKIIFTTRDNYLEDLNFQFLEIFNIVPVKINVKRLEVEDLFASSKEHSFFLPKDEKLLDLIRNPFYLNEYLKFYDEKEELQYQQFKNKLWNQNIRKSKTERENCFLRLSFQRANEGQFYVNPNCESNTLDELVKDGLLGYESAGYFITHDIYEEWGLEKIIESEFIKKSKNSEFFQRIGKSLPVRRSFRNWLSEKLLLNDEDIKIFIEDAIENNHLENFWKDEIFVSVLLSDYSRRFFDLFTNELLADELKLLKKLTILLRLACKEIDESLSRFFNVGGTDLLSSKYVFTKPKGQGWKELIKFAYENIEEIGLKDINFILPIIHDWNNSNKIGETTKYSSLIALKYYKWSIDEQSYLSGDDTKNQIIQTVFYGASEVQAELIEIFESVIQNNWKYPVDPYYDLSITMLTELEGLSASRLFPKYVLKIAELFWVYTPNTDVINHFYSDSGIGVEKYFGLETSHAEYLPASAYQTPIYWLLKHSFKETLDFIINFVNRAVLAYVNSEFDGSVKKVKLVFENEEREQWISHCLWNMYRGTGSPVSPYLLQSIHMALEKFFLEMAENIDTKLLEHWLLYLLKNSESASISAVVTSIVLAYPDKTFDVAKVLFNTKEFISFDTDRYASDLTIQNQYSFMTGLNPKHKLYEDERIKTCDDKHRKQALEHQFLHYQLFRNEGVDEETAIQRQNILWEILDRYYQEIPEENEQTDVDKTWRIFLARMDRRKISITTKEIEEGILFEFNPELDSGLRNFSKNSTSKASDSFKFMSLKLWSTLKFRNDERYKEYDQYENNPKLALNEAKEITERLNSIVSSSKNEKNIAEHEFFILSNYAIPTYVCAVLFRDHYAELNSNEREYCKAILIKSALVSLCPDYQYQISDGVEAAISLLPNLLRCFPEEEETIKTILLLTLFLEFPAGGFFSNARFNIFTIHAIRSLWKDNLSDAQSLLIGYLLLAPHFEDYMKRLREENHKKGNHHLIGYKLLPEFYDENKLLFNKVFGNKIILNDINQICDLNLSILKTAFLLIPSRINNKDVEKITKTIISIFAQKLPLDRRKNNIEYDVKHDFLEGYAYFILGLETNDIQEFINPFIENFNTSEVFADLFQEFVIAEAKIGSYNSFWVVWNLFKEKVIGICEKGDRYWPTEKIVKSYLFAHPYWKEDLKKWQSLKDNDKRFFNEISKKIGPSPSALYAISMLLDGIGNHYLDDGIIWISNMLKNNNELFDLELEKNTIYYIENIVRKYMFRNLDKAKKTKSIKDSIIVILDFLIARGSVVGYMVRESII